MTSLRIALNSIFLGALPLSLFLALNPSVDLLGCLEQNQMECWGICELIPPMLFTAKYSVGKAIWIEAKVAQGTFLLIFPHALLYQLQMPLSKPLPVGGKYPRCFYGACTSLPLAPDKPQFWGNTAQREWVSLPTFRGLIQFLFLPWELLHTN